MTLVGRNIMFDCGMHMGYNDERRFPDMDDPPAGYVVVSASVYEGFGLTVLEALTRGRPVVASAIPAHVELVGDAARLFPPGEVGALTAALDELLRDRAARDGLRHRALERARRYQVANTVDGHLAAYEHAVSDPRPRFGPGSTFSPV